MAHIIFFEKPGCINNARQKKLLRQAGHQVIVKDLLSESWSEKSGELRAFFADKPVAEWFNRAAPMIKQGLIKPSALDEKQAIAAMIAEPLLIRRPLMQVGEEKMAGFNVEDVNAWIGLAGLEKPEDIEKCAKTPQPDCKHA